jgi:catechol 2,3-dioxygenase
MACIPSMVWSKLAKVVFFRNVCLSDALLRVRSLAGTLGFYRGVLGLRVISSSPQRAELSANGDLPALLVLEEHVEAPARAPGTPGLFHLAWRFADRVALATAIRRLAEHHHPPQGASDHGVSEAIYLADPEGNGLELYSDRPPELWPRDKGSVSMFTRPLALRTLLSLAEPTGDDYSTPPGSRLGHVHLNVSDLDAAENLMVSRFGMQVRQRSIPGSLFFGYDGYHHHVATNTWNIHRPAQPGSLGLASFTLRLTPELLKIGAPQTSVLDAITIHVSTWKG